MPENAPYPPGALRQAYLLLILVALFWAGNALVGKLIVGDVPPIALAFWRWLVAGLLFAPFAWRACRAALPHYRRHWRWLVALSVLSVGTFNTVLYVGLQYTTALNAAVLNAAMPIIITLLAWLIYRTRIRRITVAGIALSLLGVLAIVAHGDLAALLALELNRGDLIAVIAYASWALYTVLLQRHRPPGLSGTAFLAFQIPVGLLFILPFYLWEAASGATIHLGTASLAGIAYLGIFPSLLAYICWNRGVAVAGAAVAGIFTNLVPALAALGAVLFLGEAFALYHLFGILVMAVGVVLVTRGERQARALPR